MATKQAKSTAASGAAEPQFVDVVAKSEWHDFPENYVLRISLPGFRKEEFRVQVDNTGKLTVKGQRPIGEGVFARVHRVFKLPKDSDVDSISGRFESNTLSLAIPKKPVVEEEEPIPGVGKKSEIADDRNGTKEEPKAAVAGEPPKEPTGMAESGRVAEAEKPLGRKIAEKMTVWGDKLTEEFERLSNSKLAGDVVETISKNKEAVAVAVAALSVGLLISYKLRSK